MSKNSAQGLELQLDGSMLAAMLRALGLVPIPSAHTCVCTQTKSPTKNQKLSWPRVLPSSNGS
jgi:hypothetical protein